MKLHSELELLKVKSPMGKLVINKEYITHINDYGASDLKVNGETKYVGYAQVHLKTGVYFKLTFDSKWRRDQFISNFRKSQTVRSYVKVISWKQFKELELFAD